MIVLDANILRTIVPGSALYVALRALANTSGHVLAIPETVLNEYASWRHRTVASKLRDAQKAVRELLDTGVAWEHRSTWEHLQPPAVDTVPAAVEQELRRTFQILDLRGEDAREALRREAYRLRPASIDMTEAGGRGARDASIWLTVLNACANAESDTVHLVSQDGDFGTKNGLLHAELADEAPGNLRYCRGIEPLFQQLAVIAEMPNDEAIATLTTNNVQLEVSKRLNTDAVMAEMLAHVRARAGIVGTLGALAGHTTCSAWYASNRAA